MVRYFAQVGLVDDDTSFSKYMGMTECKPHWFLNADLFYAPLDFNVLFFQQFL